MKEVTVISRSIPAKARSGYYQGTGSVVQGGGTSSAPSIDISGKLDASVFYKAFALEFDPEDPTVLVRIKALAGLYTDQFLSALGLDDSTTGGGGGGGGASTLGQLNNVGEWADEVPQADRVLVQLAGATHWSSKLLSELVGLDEEALADYLADNKYATQEWVNTKLGSYATTSAMNSALGNKVDKVAGKGLSSNDFTDALLTKLNGIEEGANKYVLPTATGSVLGGVKVGATLAIASGVLNMKAVGTAGTYTKVTVDAYGRVTGHASLAATDIPNLPWSKITSGKPTTLAGYGITDAYTKQETDTKLSAKLDKATFEELFEKVELSDGTFAIHAKFGLYSDSFLSALGMNPDIGGGGGASSLSELSDVSLSGLQDGQALTWDAAAQKWMNKTLEAGLDEEALAEYLASNNYLTAATGDNRYVKKTGDTMTGTLRVRTSANPYGALLTGDSSSGYLQLGNMTDNAGSHRGVICGPGGARIKNLTIIASETRINSNLYLKTNSGSGVMLYPGFGDSDSEALRIDTHNSSNAWVANALSISRGGWIGIGTVNPQYRLHVNGSGYFANTLTVGGSVTVAHSSSNCGARLTGDTDTGYLQLGNMSSTSSEQKGIICGYSTANLASLNVKGTTNDVLKVNNYTVLNTANYASTLDSRYVKKSGDTMTGTLTLPASSGAVYPESSLLFSGGVGKIGTSGSTGHMGLYATGDIYLRPQGTTTSSSNYSLIIGSNSLTYNNNKVWHSGNDGSGSGLDADTVDGVHNGNLAAAVLNSQGRSGMITGKPTKTGLQMFDVYAGEGGYPASYGNLLRLRGSVSSGCGELLLGWSGSNNGIEHIYYRNNRDMSETWSEWRTVAFTTDNVASATRLQSARTIWGQTFDGTGNVDGIIAITSNGNTLRIGSINSSWYHIYGDQGRPFIVNNKFCTSGNHDLGESNYKWHNLYLSGYAYCDSWFQNNVNGCGLYNSAQNARWYANAGCWNTDKPIIPKANNTQSVGTSSYRFNYGYFTNMNLSGNLTVQGTIYSKIGVYTDGYVSALGNNTSSDMRLKDKLADIRLPVEAVAAAPAMLFAWKRNGLRDVGSSAQYWQGILPEAVKERGGWLEMEYGNLALVSAISIAKKVVSHEERIAQLEKENIGLKNKIKELERRAA